MIRGIGIRAILLIVAFLLIGFWVVSIAMKIAGAIIHFALIAAIVLIVAAFIIRKTRKLRSRL